MAGLLGMNEPDPLTLGLLGFSQAISTPRSRGGGVAAALGAFPAGQMQAAEMQRARQQDAMRQQLMQAQIGKYQFDMDTSRAAAEAAQGEQRRLAELGEWIQANKPELYPAFRLDPKSVAQQLLPKKPSTVTLKPGEVLYQEGQYDTPLATAPDKPPTPTPLEQYLQARDRFPVGSENWNLFNDAARKASTHAPAASQTVFTGQVVPVEIGGRPAYVMPGKDGTVVPIPGIAPPGTQQKADAAAASSAAQISNADRNIVKVDEALANINRFTTGITGSLAARIPGTSAVDLRASIETIKANLAFEQLRAMREASPTGGALGAVSERELSLLESAVSSLNVDQSPETLQRNLQQVRQHLEAWKSAVTQARLPGGQTPTTPGAAPAAPAVAPPAPPSAPSAAPAPASTAPSANKPKSKIVKLDDGTSVNAKLGPDGNYYVERNNKRYRVEE